MISVRYWYGIGNISLRYYKLGLQNNLWSHPKEMCNFFEYEKTRTLMTPLDKNWEKSEIDTIWNGCIPFAPEFSKILVKVLASTTFVQSQSHLTTWSLFFFVSIAQIFNKFWIGVFGWLKWWYPPTLQKKKRLFL